MARTLAGMHGQTSGDAAVMSGQPVGYLRLDSPCPSWSSTSASRAVQAKLGLRSRAEAAAYAAWTARPAAK